MFVSYKVFSISRAVCDSKAMLVPSVLDAIEGFDLSDYGDTLACVDALFDRFVDHISQYWRYARKDALSDDLLSKQKIIYTDCGVISTAFCRVLDYVGLEVKHSIESLNPKDVGADTMLFIATSLFDSGWNYRVKQPGNSRFKAEMFDIHYYCKVNGRIYDPTLAVTSDTPHYIELIYLKRSRLRSGSYVAKDDPFTRVVSDGDRGYIYSDKPCVIPHASLRRQEYCY